MEIRTTPAIAYARVSTESQAEDELPITAQLEEIRKFASARGMEIVEEFVDAGVTGRTEDRPEFSRLRKIISSGQAYFSAVVVWRSNRFARSARIAQGFRFLLEQKSIRLYSVTEPEMNGSVGVLMNGILDAFNEFYSAQLGEDTFRGMIASAKAGYALGGVTPYGLRRVPVILESGGVKKKYEPDPSQAAIVRRIYQEYAEGNGLYTIARGLNRDGIRTKTGKDWEQTSIHHILFKNRPYYQGRMIFNRTKTLIKKRVSNKPEDEWIIVDGAHEAIIDPELAERVDRRRRDVPRPNFQKGSDGTHNLLNGLIFCGLCGARFSGNKAVSGKRENGVYRWYYGCTARKRSSKVDKSDLCSNAYIRQEVVEDAVMEEIRKSFRDLDTIQEIIHEAQKELTQGHEDKGALAAQLRSDLAEQKKRRDNLLDAVEQGALPLADVAERLAKAKDRIHVLELKLRDLDEPSEASPLAIDAEKISEVVCKMLDDPARKREVYLTFVERVDVFPERITVKLRVPGKG